IPLTPLEKEQMFVDILPEAEEDDGIAYLSFFVEAPEDAAEKQALIEERSAAIRQQLDGIREYMEIGTGTLQISETEDLDWINNWKQYFHQFTIDDDILVIPSWENVEPEDRNKMILHIDPGTAFGTGMHETTQLCIRQLKKYVTTDTRLLDVGTGSGILSILSLMFGAKEALGTDLDPCAVDAVADNIKTNGIDPAKFTLLIGNIINDPKIREQVGQGYDIAAANILAEVLVPLIPVLPAHLKRNGILITSGIIEGKEKLVADTMKANGFEVLDISAQGEWRSVTGKLI
ncbi:MAG: 50S ribosomal protein L11 methyltransferase, partial [Lachnospiraceae bacterium]|nr:50S ribosomal protein L11 methyltransferase [Lachnospiraceae bacterium]